MSKLECTLGYNDRNDRYGLLRGDLWYRDGLTCGARMEVLIDGEWIPTRLEFHGSHKILNTVFCGSAYREQGWYLIGTPYHGDLLEHLHVRVDG